MCHHVLTFPACMVYSRRQVTKVNPASFALSHSFVVREGENNGGTVEMHQLLSRWRIRALLVGSLAPPRLLQPFAVRGARPPPSQAGVYPRLQLVAVLNS